MNTFSNLYILSYLIFSPFFWDEKTLNEKVESTGDMRRGRCRRGTERFWGTWAWRGRSEVWEDCTNRHCRWGERSLEGRSLWRWQRWKGYLDDTISGHRCIWFRSTLHSWNHCWIEQCLVPQCSRRSLGNIGSRTHTPLLQRKHQNYWGVIHSIYVTLLSWHCVKLYNNAYILFTYVPIVPEASLPP